MDQLVEPLAHRYQSAHVTKVFEDISPGKGLTELSREAQLVVVGSSGHGRLAETILGSVSQNLLHHAECRCWWSGSRHRGPADLTLSEVLGRVST